ncbi:MAG: DUF5615 family PIN-like protein [Phenylobacterium sp.]|uniref:DUF5615 family PIN-like protein n=1 Tax=Phenylobacterium sp. TaxID=1871053 RepID=UPI00271AA3E4|nr:DUF5615 family PIN-like protein [Phenylobacterium sp.]MDO9429863.1 DUF5615 family PIN-like protein [Phenylobacterium sp.]
MRLLVDECVDRAVVQALIEAGHDLVRLPPALLGTADLGIAAHAVEIGRIVLTQDYDFGEIAVRHGLAVPGVLLLACQSLPMIERVPRVVAGAGEAEGLYEGHLTIIEPGRTRRRKL